MKKNILLFIIVLAYVNLNAQKSKEDSLVLLLNKSVDSSKVNILNELSRSLWYYQLNKATAYNLQAMSLADSIAYQPGIAEANRCRGVILSFKNDSSGMPYLIKALNIFKALDNKKGIAATLNNQGSAYLKQGQFSKALDVLFQALKLFSELGDKEAVGASTNQVGNVYALLRDYAAALDYYSKALAIRRQIADKPGTAFSLNRIGDMYFKLGKLSEAITNYKESYDISLSVGRSQNIIDAASNIGNVYKLQGKYNDALSYFKTSLIEEEKFFGKDNIGFSYQHIGETYLALKNYNASLFNFQKALQIAYKKKSNDAAIILQQVGRVYFEQGDYIKALENCLHSLDLAKQTKNNEAVKETSLTLSQVYAAKGDFVNAYRYHQQYASAKDSILNENLNNKLASLEQSFEVKNRQTQIDLLNRDNELQQSEISRQKQQRYAFIAGIFLFAVLAVLLFRSNRHKQKTNLAVEKAYHKLEQTHETLKATQTQLIQSEKMASLGALTAGIAHEIQNPLNFVNNFSEVNKEMLEELKPHR
jgi:two-component system NtrC family sensor kinase